ncbi:hypothetical protein ACYULU_15130, partial [Breznakiellaceae bacterium SP9]
EEGTYSTTIYEHSFGHLSFTAWKHCCFSLLTGSKLGKIKTADYFLKSVSIGKIGVKKSPLSWLP